MAESVYGLCALTSLVCALLMAKSYLRSRMPLLFWTSLCFACLALNNVLLVIDLSLVDSWDLGHFRNVASLTGVGVLLYGLIRADRG